MRDASQVELTGNLDGDFPGRSTTVFSEPFEIVVYRIGRQVAASRDLVKDANELQPRPAF